MIQATQLKRGMCIKHDNELFRIVEAQHKTPGNLRGLVQAKIRNLRTGAISEHRFRSNIAVEGLEAWEELNWIGRRIRVGAVEFEAVEPKTRCLATHANPKTGKRDIPIMEILLKAFPKRRPTFAICLIQRGRGGTIRVGDKIQVSG
jgi:uncharacterized protein YcbX